MEYGHAERNLIAAQRAIAETIELLLRLPSLNEEQVQFVQEFAPERIRRPGPRTTVVDGADRPEAISPAAPAAGPTKVYDVLVPIQHNGPRSR
jgi:hypothetical protein